MCYCQKSVYWIVFISSLFICAVMAFNKSVYPSYTNLPFLPLFSMLPTLHSPLSTPPPYSALIHFVSLSSTHSHSSHPKSATFSMIFRESRWFAECELNFVLCMYKYDFHRLISIVLYQFIIALAYYSLSIHSLWSVCCRFIPSYKNTGFYHLNTRRECVEIQLFLWNVCACVWLRARVYICKF